MINNKRKWQKETILLPQSLSLAASHGVLMAEVRTCDPAAVSLKKDEQNGKRRRVLPPILRLHNNVLGIGYWCLLNAFFNQSKVSHASNFSHSSTRQPFYVESWWSQLLFLTHSSYAKPNTALTATIETQFFLELDFYHYLSSFYL